MDQRLDKITRTRHTTLRIRRLVAVLFCLIAICCSCKHKGEQTSPSTSDQSHVTFLDQPISYCVQTPTNLETGDVQVLIDGSGSMVGFNPSLPGIIKWSQHALSALHNSTMTIRNSRVCSFREKEGITGCAEITGQAPTVRPHGNTNLHEAIASAKNYALTFIVTDGVAATGDIAKGDCASGVDAACVARSLVESLKKGETTDEPGLWIVPLVAPYDGSFFTEETISPSNFRAEETIKKVRSDIPLDVAIQNPHSAADGKLVFDYKGPRSLLLIVIARKSDTGRAAIEGLVSRSDYLNIRQLGQIKNYSGGVAAMTPVEIYPGFLNKVTWQSLKESEEPNSSSGTIDVKAILSDQSNAAVEVNCPNASENWGIYTLMGTDRPSQTAGCVRLQMLPGFNLDVRAARSEDDSESRDFLKSSTMKSNEQPSLEMKIGCSSAITRRCEQNPIRLQLVAIMNYAKTADSIVSTLQSGSTSELVRGLSTAHPSDEPHKISAFSLILQLFYRSISGDARSTVLNSFEICKK